MPATKGGTEHWTAWYLMRAPAGSLGNKAAYQYFSGTPNVPRWSSSNSAATPVFTDRGGVNDPSITYDRALGRYLLLVGHGADAGHLGLFEGDEPWGPWRTVDYEDRGLGMTGGDYLGVQFPSAWLSADGRTLWAVFSCYGKGGCGRYQDRYNLISGRLRLSSR